MDLRKGIFIAMRKLCAFHIYRRGDQINPGLFPFFQIMLFNDLPFPQLVSKQDLPCKIQVCIHHGKAFMQLHCLLQICFFHF